MYRSVSSLLLHLWLLVLVSSVVTVACLLILVLLLFETLFVMLVFVMTFVSSVPLVLQFVVAVLRLSVDPRLSVVPIVQSCSLMVWVMVWESVMRWVTLSLHVSMMICQDVAVEQERAVSDWDVHRRSGYHPC